MSSIITTTSNNPFSSLEELNKEINLLDKQKTGEHVEDLFLRLTEILKTNKSQLLESAALEPQRCKFLGKMSRTLRKISSTLFLQERPELSDQTIQGAIKAIQQVARAQTSPSEPKEYKTAKPLKQIETKEKESSPEDLRDRMGSLTAENMRELASVHSKCTQGYKKDAALLRKGWWYFNDFYKANEEKKQVETIKFLSRPSVFRNGLAPSEYFSRIKNSKGDIVPKHYRIKEGVLPSKAITSLFQDLVIGDCGMATLAARYRTLLKVLGPKFDHIFKYNNDKTDILPLTTGFVGDTSQPMVYFTKPTFTDEGKKFHRNIKIGQVVGFKGAEEYGYKKPLDHARSFNTICTNDTPGKQTFAGLGLKDSATEEDIEKHLIDAFNSEEDSLSFVPKELMKQYFKDKLVAETYKGCKTTTVPGFRHKTVTDFNIPLIKDLLKTSTKKITRDFIVNHPSNQETYNIYTR